MENHPRGPGDHKRSSPDPTHSRRYPTPIESAPARPFVLFVSFVVPAFLHGDRDATASSPPAITGSSCRFAASDDFIA